MVGIPTPDACRFLIWGGNGWVASQLYDLLKHHNRHVSTTTVRMEDVPGVQRILDEVKPTHVLNCAGKTGRPNVDWCESHKLETVEANVTGTLALAHQCELRDIHLTVFATGCIYEYDAEHPEGGKGFKESDPANFHGSWYSLTKASVENVMKHSPHLILRLRMPVSDDLHDRNFVTKITKYERVVNVENSNSILHDLLPAAIILAEHCETGVYNFTNPGAISHNEILAMYKEIIDPTFTWKNFSLQQQSEILAAGRSNCKLDTQKLMMKMGEYDYEISEVHEAYRRCFERMVQNDALQKRKHAVSHDMSVKRKRSLTVEHEGRNGPVVM